MRATRRRHTGVFFPTLLLLLGFLLLPALPVQASVAVLLEEPYGAFSHVSPSGHVAIYMDHVCAETPVRLRPCRPGELGAVISRYHGIGNRDWIAVPLLGYLYAVGDRADIPVTVTRADAASLREAYRRANLLSVVPTRANGSAPGGNWYELAGASFDRTIFGFEVRTSAAADAALIRDLNEQPNRDVFNGMFRNCADFARETVNRFYPGAIRRNYVADLGFSSPKSMARGLARFAARHPETQFQVFRIDQLSGDMPRSHPAVTLTEGVVKEFGLPLVVLAPVTTSVLAAAYLTNGRFAEPVNAPLLNLRTDVAPPRSFAPRQDAAVQTALSPTPAQPREAEAGETLPAVVALPSAATRVTSSATHAAAGATEPPKPVPAGWTAETAPQL